MFTFISAHKPSQKALKQILGMATLVILGTAGTLTALANGGQSPAFNNQPNDYATILVANPNGTWQTSLSNVKPGDLVDVGVWDDNTVVGSHAANVVVKADLQAGINPSPVLTGSVSADNAATASAKATLNTNGTAVKLTYLAGSATLYRPVNGNLTPTAWPTGSVGDDVVASGTHFANQDGGFINSQMIIFQVRVEAGSPVAAISEDGVLTGAGSYTNSTINAQPGDIIDVRSKVDNIGTASGVGTTVTTHLPAKMTFLGNAFVDYKNGTTDQTIDIPSSQITVTGNDVIFHWKDMPADQGATFYLGFQTKVADASQFSTGTTALSVSATAAFQNATPANSNALTIAITKSANPIVSFTVSNQAKNLSSGFDKWYDNTIPAVAVKNDIITFQIQLLNTGNTTASNVTVKDSLPAGFTFKDSTTLFNRANQNGVALSGGNSLVNNGYTFNALQSGNLGYQYIQFNAQVPAVCITPTTYTNKVDVMVNGAVVAHDFMDIYVACQSGLSVIKEVKDPADGQFKQSVSGLKNGQDITYRITTFNIDHPTVLAAQLVDVLPLGLVYKDGSMTVDGAQVSSTSVQKSLFSTGIALPTLEDGHSKQIFFTATAPCLSATTKYTNVAKVSVSGSSTLTASADATVVGANCSTPTPTPVPSSTPTPTSTPKVTPTATPTTPSTPSTPTTLPRTGAGDLGFLLTAGFSGGTATVGRFWHLKNKLKKQSRNLDIQ